MGFLPFDLRCTHSATHFVGNFVDFVEIMEMFIFWKRPEHISTSTKTPTSPSASDVWHTCQTRGYVHSVNRWASFAFAVSHWAILHILLWGWTGSVSPAWCLLFHTVGYRYTRCIGSSYRYTRSVSVPIDQKSFSTPGTSKILMLSLATHRFWTMARRLHNHLL